MMIVATDSDAKRAWHTLANHFSRLVSEQTFSSASLTLARLVLAEHCSHEWSGNGGGPTMMMVRLAENIADVNLARLLVDVIERKTI